MRRKYRETSDVVNLRACVSPLLQLPLHVLEVLLEMFVARNLFVQRTIRNVDMDPRLIRKADEPEVPLTADMTQQVLEVLVKQLGHGPADAKRMIAKALKRKPSISTPEELFDEVYRGEVAL